MASIDSWRSIFESWPDSFPKRGMVITSFGESIPFVNFMIAGGIVLLEREKPDALGARKIMLAYEHIAAIKITDVIELARFHVLGFQNPM